GKSPRGAGPRPRAPATKDMSVERRLPIASEGWPFIVGSAVIAAGLTLAGRRRLALPFWAASLASAGFFRDPERDIPVVANGVLAPADGRVLGVEDAVDPFLGSSTPPPVLPPPPPLPPPP